MGNHWLAGQLRHSKGSYCICFASYQEKHSEEIIQQLEGENLER